MIRLFFVFFLASATSVLAADEEFPRQYKCEGTGGFISSEPTGDEKRGFKNIKTPEDIYVRFMDSREQSFLLYAFEEHRGLFFLPRVWRSSDGSKQAFSNIGDELNIILEVVANTDLKTADTFKIRSIHENDWLYSSQTYTCKEFDFFD